MLYSGAETMDVHGILRPAVLLQPIIISMYWRGVFKMVAHAREVHLLHGILVE